jgi:hypothetical protein
VKAKLILLAAGIILLAAVAVGTFAPGTHLGQALAALGLSAGGIGAFLAARARQVVSFLAGTLGPVQGKGDPFATIDGDPHAIDVWANSETHRVQLPPGIASGRVRAVSVIPGLKATVEVLP